MIKLKLNPLSLYIAGYREGVLSYFFEEVESKTLKTYSAKAVGASTKIDTIDNNRDYYAGGADGSDIYTETSHEIEAYTLRLFLTKHESVGLKRRVEIVKSSTSKEISEEEFNATMKKQAQDKELACIKERQESLETAISLPIQKEDLSWWMAGWDFIVPTTAWKYKECVNTRSRSYDPWTADLGRLFIGEESLDKVGLLYLAALFCEKVPSNNKTNQEAVRVHPHLPLMTSIEVKEANTPKVPEGWIEIIHDSSPWSRNSGDCLLFIDNVQIPLHDGELFNEDEPNCILIESKPVGRGNLSGYEYRLAIPKDCNYEAEYDNE